MQMQMEVPPIPLSSAPEPWESKVSARHQVDLPLVPPKRSANRVKSKPANPAVLTSIIDSLDTLTPLPDIAANEAFSETASKHSRNSISNRSVASSASIHRQTNTPGFGVEYGNGLELDDVDGLTDAALPPTVPTSRPPSGLSKYKAHTPKSAKSSNSGSFRPKPSSRRSSLSTTNTDYSARNKLSSESWVRKSSTKGAQDSDSQRGRSSQKSRLRRVASEQSLRTEGVESKQVSEELGSLSLAEKIIAKAPPQSSTSKGRLYLTDATINEDQPLEDSPPLHQSKSIGEHSVGSDGKASSARQLSAISNTPPLKTPSPIQDSIPTRTSSLRHPSSSPARKRKQKKAKRHTMNPSASETKKYGRSKSIPESSWADLGEDDETVKRIRELREQRKSRLQESDSPSLPTEKTPTPVEGSDSQHIPVYELSAPLADQAKRAPPRKKTSNRHATDQTKAHKTLGLKDDERRSHDMNGLRLNDARALSQSPELLRRTKYSLDVKRPLDVHNRPATARSADNSPILPFSLDYSYARAVDALQGDENIRPVDKGAKLRESSERSLGLKGLDLQTPEKAESISTQQSHQKSKKKRRPEDRWTAHHPDLPLAFAKQKSRRKSMSDARISRNVEDEIQASRRDSIEEAVLEYLHAPRLNRKVKNPTTGRTIAYSEVGDPNGAAVFVCVGMGLTRFVTAFYDELATTLRLRLITIDRPGVGGSEPYPSSDKSGPLNWPEDVLVICQYLGIVKFSILAHSAGAVYALATALILPHLVKGKIHLLAPWVPPSQLEAISHPTASAPPSNPLPRSQRFLRVLPTPFLKAANSSFMTATSASLKPATKRTVKTNLNRTSPPRTSNVNDVTKDKPPSRDRPEYNRRESMMLMDQYMPAMNPTENFPIPVNEEEEDRAEALKRSSLILSATATPMDPGFDYASNGLYAAEHTAKERHTEYTSRLTQATWDLATRDSNPATDLVVCLERNRDVGFRYTDVGREVVITHGSEDKRVPIANVKWLAEQMNRRAVGLDGAFSARESRESTAVDLAGKSGGCEVRVLDGEGHGLMASPVIMGDILTEIAGYWIGQDKGRL